MSHSNMRLRTSGRDRLELHYRQEIDLCLSSHSAQRLTMHHSVNRKSNTIANSKCIYETYQETKIVETKKIFQKFEAVFFAFFLFCPIVFLGVRQIFHFILSVSQVLVRNFCNKKI